MSPAFSSRRRLRDRLPIVFALAAGAALALTLSPAAVLAQPPVGKLQRGPIDLQVFRPAVDSKGFITLNASQILGPKDFSFGLVSTWARTPLELEGTVQTEDSSLSVDN